MTQRTVPAALGKLPLVFLGILPLVCLGLSMACSSANSEGVGGAPDELPVVEVQMTAQRFEFNPPRIEVKEGSRLVIKISSLDGRHGFNIIGTRTNVVIPRKGKGEVKVVFDALQKGEYPFKCSKVCGKGHADMKGVIVVH